MSKLSVQPIATIMDWENASAKLDSIMRMECA